MVVPNRLERVWKFFKPEILKKWPLLKDADLEACQYQYDLVVETIRRAYFTGRSHITLEGEIRDWMNERVGHWEREL